MVRMGMHLRSRDLLKFWEISANISETVQDRDIVTMNNLNATLAFSKHF